MYMGRLQHIITYYNNLTATSLESCLVRAIIPKKVPRRNPVAGFEGKQK